VDDGEIAWFLEHYRLGRWVGDDDAALAELRTISDPTVALVELQVIYYANPSLKDAFDLERRSGVDAVLAEYHSTLRNGKRAPKGTIATGVTPLLRRLTLKELAQAEEEARLLRICEAHPEYSAPFVGLTWYALFVLAFFLQVYCGRGVGKFWMKQGLLSSLKGFPRASNAGQMFDYLEGDWLDVMYPQRQGFSGKLGNDPNATLSCRRRQFMADGSSLRVGVPRIRQVRVGLNDQAGPWSDGGKEGVAPYSTCQVPGLFEEAMYVCLNG
jgi:hypothetical protein